MFACGHTNSNFDGQVNAGLYDAFVIKYAASGTRMWTRFYGTASSDGFQQATADAFGNLYVTGWAGAASAGQAYGTPLWYAKILYSSCSMQAVAHRT